MKREDGERALEALIRHCPRNGKRRQGSSQPLCFAWEGDPSLALFFALRESGDRPAYKTTGLIAEGDGLCVLPTVVFIVPLAVPQDIFLFADRIRVRVRSRGVETCLYVLLYVRRR